MKTKHFERGDDVIVDLPGGQRIFGRSADCKYLEYNEKYGTHFVEHDGELFSIPDANIHSPRISTFYGTILVNKLIYVSAPFDPCAALNPNGRGYRTLTTRENCERASDVGQILNKCFGAVPIVPQLLWFYTHSAGPLGPDEVRYSMFRQKLMDKCDGVVFMATDELGVMDGEMDRAVEQGKNLGRPLTFESWLALEDNVGWASKHPYIKPTTGG